jgi:glucosamine-6-phosphate deaminase
MKLIEAEDSNDFARKATELVVGQLKSKPNSLIALPTGNTPVPMFRKLVSRGDASLFRNARFVTLDEYSGIDVDDRRRLLSWLHRELLGPAGIGSHQLIAFDPTADHEVECARIEDAITSWGGLDLAVLGLGPNGHLGFNEPGSSFESRTRKVALTQGSIESNAPYWGSQADVPRYGLTLGLATLREARCILLLASGAGKAEIVARLMNEPIGAALPATILRLCPHSIFLADRAALSAGIEH